MEGSPSLPGHFLDPNIANIDDMSNFCQLFVILFFYLFPLDKITLFVDKWRFSPCGLHIICHSSLGLEAGGLFSGVIF